jgi:IS30 family transposase
MSYHQLTQTNRIEIAVLFRAGMSYRQIAHQIGCHHSTVSRELHRHAWHNPSGYDARQARLQLKRKRLDANQHKRKLPSNQKLVDLVEKKLKDNWSPEQIAGHLKAIQNKLYACVQTIYDWIYIHRRDLVQHLHCSKGKYRRTRQARLRKEKRATLAAPRNIAARPKNIEARKTYGHWEGDTVHGAGKSGYIATHVERKSGYLVARVLPVAEYSSSGFAAVTEQCFKEIAPKYSRTLTLDNGPEMKHAETIERTTGTRVYYANPYHSWERGTNENTNGLLRFYFPKKSSFATLTQEQLDQAVKEINTRPRKRLGYKTPEQMLRRCGAVRVRV